MRLSRLPVALVTGALLVGLVSCANAIDGTGTVASDVVTTGGPSPTGSSGAPSPDPTTESPTPDPTTAAPTTAAPTTNPLTTKRRLLCVLERAAITSINSQFNGSKNRDTQIRILRTGATTIRGHIRQSGLPPTDGIRQRGQSVLTQLETLVSEASKGKSPSTTSYNRATQTFQSGCNQVS